MPHAETRRPNVQLFIALLIGLAYHTSLLFFTFKRTYDAYVHIFFADHYARSWFEPWEPRWYTGFNMTSYPPASHQATALLSYLIGLQNGFIVVMVLSILFVTVGVYRFTKIWASRETAGYAALITIFATSISETAHVFGQLPTLFSLGFLLNALPYIYRWVRFGEMKILIVAWLVCAATTAGHHVTTLFGGVFFIGPLLILALLDNYYAHSPPLNPPQREGDRSPSLWNVVGDGMRQLLNFLWDFLKKHILEPQYRKALLRAIIFGVGLITILVSVVLPYWVWSVSDPITQVSIPHASRDSYIVNRPAGLIFWLIPYGFTMFFIPIVAHRLTTKRRWPLLLSFLLLVLLGTGGTTPIPQMLLGGAYEILTLDRFTFWATIVMLPFLGEWVRQLVEGEFVGRWPWLTLSVSRMAVLICAVALVMSSIFTANLTQFRRFQPEPIDMEPILVFLKKDDHDDWRYLTLGFGDQLAWLSAQTDALSVEGNYHSARRLPELTSSPIERLDGAKFSGTPGLGSLHQFLTVPEKYNLKFIFSNDPFYDPLIYFSGWRTVGRLDNNIVVWERKGIPPLPDALPAKLLPEWQKIAWGVVPLTTIGLAAVSVFLLKQSGQLPRWWSRRFGMFIVGGAAVALLAWGGVVIMVRTGAGSAEATLLAYYDALDFRQFEDAYDLLNPETRPDYETYLEIATSQGGLIGSYAKLNNLFTTVVSDGQTEKLIRADAEWVTALDVMRSTETHRLTRSGVRWTVEPPEREEGLEEVANVAQVNLELVSARLLQSTDAWYVVGEIRNGGDVTADLTVRGQLLSVDGEVVGRNNAQTIIQHTLLPAQTTPFRIEIGDVLTNAVNFDVELLGFPTIEEAYPLSAVPLDRLETDGSQLMVQIDNQGCLDVSITQLLIAQRDGNGEVVWVDEHYVQTPIPHHESVIVTAPVNQIVSNPQWWLLTQNFILPQLPNC